MTLFGSRTEQQIRDLLIESNLGLQNSEYGNELTRALHEEQVDLRTAYILNWLPEQAEDIFDILHGGPDIIIVKVSRAGAPTTTTRSTVDLYLAGKSKARQLTLAVAQKLVRSHGSDAQV
jgi:hypothetical protein